MNICPLCNGLRNIDIFCSDCGNILEDMGRLMDYFGDYSPYMEIDQMKLVDGYDDYNSHQCPHLFFCSLCSKDEIVLIKE